MGFDSYKPWEIRDEEKEETSETNPYFTPVPEEKFESEFYDQKPFIWVEEEDSPRPGWRRRVFDFFASRPFLSVGIVGLLAILIFAHISRLAGSQQLVIPEYVPFSASGISTQIPEGWRLDTANNDAQGRPSWVWSGIEPGYDSRMVLSLAPPDAFFEYAWNFADVTPDSLVIKVDEFLQQDRTALSASLAGSESTLSKSNVSFKFDPTQEPVSYPATQGQLGDGVSVPPYSAPGRFWTTYIFMPVSDPAISALWEQYKLQNNLTDVTATHLLFKATLDTSNPRTAPGVGQSILSHFLLNLQWTPSPS